MEKTSWFKRKRVTGGFSMVSIIAGFLFLNQGSITGNVIVDSQPVFNMLSVVGLLLIFCSAILAFYTLRK